MPELPEVETIVRYLRPKIRGKRILGIWSNTPRLFRQNVQLPVLNKLLLGRKIMDAVRLGKNLIFMLEGNYDLYLHLMMTGKLLWNPRNVRGPHIRFRMRLSGGGILVLHDIRKFGWIRLIRRSPTSRGKSGFEKLNLGPDALSLSFQKFRDVFKKRKGAIKPLLLNQSVISGIGNIYSDEILWYAGIYPKRKADSLGYREVKKLYSALRHILGLAIRKGGASARDYRKPDGSKGGYYEIRKAYQRTGERCSLEGAVIKRIKIGQRSAHFCPHHQK